MNEIISVAQMFDIDGACPEAGVPTRTLMENAGRAVADTIGARFTQRSVAVLCGPGNNGGDGWVAARVLAEKGWPVSVHTLAARERLKGDAAEAAALWSSTIQNLDAALPEADLYIDALFGAGLSRALDGAAAEIAKQLARMPEKVVAIDVPSGLDGDNGQPRGEACVRAALTVTFVRKKPAHMLVPGRDYCGEVVVADITTLRVDAIVNEGE